MKVLDLKVGGVYVGRSSRTGRWMRRRIESLDRWNKIVCYREDTAQDGTFGTFQTHRDCSIKTFAKWAVRLDEEKGFRDLNKEDPLEDAFDSLREDSPGGSTVNWSVPDGNTVRFAFSTQNRLPPKVDWETVCLGDVFEDAAGHPWLAVGPANPKALAYYLLNLKTLDILGDADKIGRLGLRRRSAEILVNLR